MPLFKWTKAHAVFINEIDAQHRNLMDMADDLHRAILAGAETPRTLELLKALIAAAEDHFNYEERLMRSSQYSAYDWHRQQHDTVRRGSISLCHGSKAGREKRPCCCSNSFPTG